MTALSNFLRFLITFLSFPHNLKDEKINNKQNGLIDELYDKSKLILKDVKRYEKNKLITHKKFSNSLLSLFINKKLKNFLRIGFIQKMFFVHNRLYNKYFLKNILDTNSNFWIKLLNENPVGNPVPFFLYKKSSGNRIRHIYLFKKIYDFANIDSSASIIEIGGGYGCMLDIANKAIEDLNYLIFDLPEVNLLQYYYLKSNDINCELDEINAKLILTSKIEIMKKKLDFLKRNGKKIVLIANWSLSEMPLLMRENLKFLISECDYSEISFQSSFENISNLDYFLNLKIDLKKKYHFDIKEIKEMNGFINKNKHYLILLRKHVSS